MLLYVTRQLETTVKAALRTFPAVLVTGARQTGKTTLLREVFEGRFSYLSLERPDVRARAIADPIGFFAETRGPRILDEIQYTPGLLPYVKDQIDADRVPGRWLLSGSQSFALMRDVTQSLAGRVAVLELDPLAVAESAGLPSVDDFTANLAHVFAATSRSRLPSPAIELGDWLLRGGYPELRLNQEVNRKLWLSSYVQTYLERDVRDLLNVGDLNAFSRFLSLAAARSGNLLNLTDLGRDAGVSGPTAKRWLSVLEASQIVYVLQPYHVNFGKRLVKSPKLYFLDPALLAFLLGLHDREAILKGPAADALFESAVLGEWVKAARSRGERPAIYFFRASGGLEVDFVIDHGGRLYGIEAKVTATPTPRHAESVAAWMRLVGDRARGVVACNVAKPQALAPGIRAVPWHLAW